MARGHIVRLRVAYVRSGRSLIIDYDSATLASTRVKVASFTCSRNVAGLACGEERDERVHRW